MRGLAVITAAFLIGLTSMISEESKEFLKGPVPTIPLSLNGSDWRRLEPATWEASSVDGKPTKFRVDRKKDGSLLLYHSLDGFKWEAKSDQSWKDSEGNYFRIVVNSVAFSDDGGISWTELKHCIWQDTEGHWMMLDREGRLWQMKEKEQAKESEINSKE
jgi:hypothetical protein